MWRTNHDLHVYIIIYILLLLLYYYVYVIATKDKYVGDMKLRINLSNFKINILSRCNCGCIILGKFLGKIFCSVAIYNFAVFAI